MELERETLDNDRPGALTILIRESPILMTSSRGDLEDMLPTKATAGEFGSEPNPAELLLQA